MQPFPSSPIFSLPYVRYFQLAVLEPSGHNCPGIFFLSPINLLSSFAGDICEGAASASVPEQLHVPVSRAVGRCLAESSIPPTCFDSWMPPAKAMAFIMFNTAKPCMLLGCHGCSCNSAGASVANYIFHSWTQYRHKNLN